MSLIDDLSPAERLALIGELWDSLDETDIPVTDDQRAELDDRMAGHRVGESIPWAEAKALLLKRLG